MARSRMPTAPARSSRARPTSKISFVGSSSTNSDGQVELKITYGQSVASWLEFNILVAASGVAGTEGRTSYQGVLPVLADAISDPDVEPAFRLGPYGTAGQPGGADDQSRRARPACSAPTRTDAVTITLVGMPGCGKSTVGRHLARHLGLRLVDSDHEIEKRIGMPIRSWFEAPRRSRFPRHRAAGDRAAVRARQRRRAGHRRRRGAARTPTASGCAQRTHVFYLRSTPEELFRRLRHDTHRPLLQVADPLRRLRELYRERDPLYRQTAHYIIETGRPSVPTLVNMVLMQLELAGLVDPQRVPSPIDAARAMRRRR